MKQYDVTNLDVTSMDSVVEFIKANFVWTGAHSHTFTPTSESNVTIDHLVNEFCHGQAKNIKAIAENIKMVASVNLYKVTLEEAVEVAKTVIENTGVVLKKNDIFTMIEFDLAEPERACRALMALGDNKYPVYLFTTASKDNEDAPCPDVIKEAIAEHVLGHIPPFTYIGHMTGVRLRKWLTSTYGSGVYPTITSFKSTAAKGWLS